MKLNRLELDFFRNYAHVEATFHPRVNLIYGDNAQGKTNLLEAIAYLSSARSHRARYDRELIMLDQPQGYIKGEVDSRERTFILAALVQRPAAENRRRAGGDSDHRPLLSRGSLPHPGGGRRPAALSGRGHLSAASPVCPGPGRI